MTLVKYYNGHAYQFCVANYYHTGEIALKLMSPTWERSTDNNHNYVLTDNVPMPGPGGLWCSPWRNYPGRESVDYWWERFLSPARGSV